MFGGSNPSFLIMIVAMFAVMYFTMILPQKKKEKALKAFRDGLKKGDEVVTRGGIYGKVLDVKDDIILLEVSAAAKIRVELSSVSAVAATKKA